MSECNPGVSRIEFSSKQEAEKLLRELEVLVTRFEMVSVGEFEVLLGWLVEDYDALARWGWFSIEEMKIEEQPEGKYLLTTPLPELLFS